MATGSLGGLDAAALALSRLLPLKFSERRKGLSDEPADRGGIVQPRHVQNPHQDAAPVLLIEKDDQFAGAAAELVQAFHNQFVTEGQTRQQGGQVVACFHPAFDLLNDLGAADLGERSPLTIEILIIC